MSYSSMSLSTYFLTSLNFYESVILEPLFSELLKYQILFSISQYETVFMSVFGYRLIPQGRAFLCWRLRYPVRIVQHLTCRRFFKACYSLNELCLSISVDSGYANYFSPFSHRRRLLLRRRSYVSLKEFSAPRPDKTTSEGFAGSLFISSCTGLPTIMVDSSCLVTSFVSTVPIYFPLCSTVTLSDTAIISFNL